MSVLVVEGLQKSYRVGFWGTKNKVLNEISFKIEPGKITGFLGGNGAGKTTTMKCLLGLAFPDQGEISYFGGLPLNSEVKRRIGFLPERPYFYDYLTGEEFLQFYGQISTRLTKKDLKARILDLLKKVDLVFAKDRSLRDYSKGMLQKIGFAQALIHDPDFVILDEPMSGLDPDGRYYLAELIKQTAYQGKAIFFSSHLLNDAEKLCEDLVIIKGGRVAYQGSTIGLLGKMHNEISITYSKEGELITEAVTDIALVQNKIDELRSQKLEIMEIVQDMASLEEAFVKVGLRGES